MADLLAGLIILAGSFYMFAGRSCPRVRIATGLVFFWSIGPFTDGPVNGPTWFWYLFTVAATALAWWE